MGFFNGVTFLLLALFSLLPIGLAASPEPSESLTALAAEPSWFKSANITSAENTVLKNLANSRTGICILCGGIDLGRCCPIEAPIASGPCRAGSSAAKKAVCALSKAAW
ncbi:hypothetical protein BDV93DRAFT_507439 [Ceratobasidium sp. AG-I]|nr:hypothetical protein BDV93DRAFT_507439 [Ceratobasidium sp. AG-I]